jgi:hypothetical protein
VLACRPAELEDNAELRRVLLGLRRRYPVEEIRLEPLGEQAIAALVGSDVPAERLAQLASESGGNPLIALEMARAGGSADVPRTLADLVLARVDALPPDAAALVRWAAVFERGPLALLEQAATAQVSGFLDAMETAVRYSLLRSSPWRTRSSSGSSPNLCRRSGVRRCTAASSRCCAPRESRIRGSASPITRCPRTDPTSPPRR